MRIAKIDWSSDYTLFFLGTAIVLLVIIIALDRYSPKKQKGRRLDERRGEGDLID